MKSRARIIEEMCMTMRHDFGLDKIDDSICAGMSEPERRVLRTEMQQLIEHHGADIATLYAPSQWCEKFTNGEPQP